MSLKLYYHPLSSYCWKALIALYEGDVHFEREIVNLGDEAERAAFLKLWPIGKFPLLTDSATGAVVPESSIIIEYLQDNAPGFPALIPQDKKLALEARLKDRFYDHYVHTPMNVFTQDRLRPKDARDFLGLAQAERMLRTAYAVANHEIAAKHWALGESFTIADCSAFPALYYADRYVPIGPEHPALAAYLARLHERPSVNRAFKEAAPFMHMFPGNSQD